MELFETTDDDIIIRKLSTIIYDNLQIDGILFDQKLSNAPNKELNIGTIGELTGYYGNNEIYDRLLNVSIVLFNKYKGNLGTWHPPNIIKLNLSYYKTALDPSDKYSRRTRIKSTLRHEMRHALDYILSNRPTPKYQYNMPHADRPREINAFYTQAIMDIIDEFDKYNSIKTQKNLSEYIKNEIKWAFEKNKIKRNNPKYKRLVNRAYNYIVRYLEGTHNQHSDTITNQIKIIHPDQIGTAIVAIDKSYANDIQEYIEEIIDDADPDYVQSLVKNLNTIKSNIGKSVAILKAEEVNGDQLFCTAILPNGQSFTAYVDKNVNDHQYTYNMGLTDVRLNNSLNESILLETTDDDIIIRRISDIIEDKLNDAFYNKKLGVLGKIGELSGLYGNTPEYKQLMKVKIILYDEQDNRDGYWNPNDNSININCYYWMAYPPTTFRHEVRHALDEFLSKGKYYTQKHVDTMSHKHRPGEINAHYTEAVTSVIELISRPHIKNLKSKDIIKYINDAFRDYKVPLNNRYYKHLFNRAYQYVVRYLEGTHKLHSNIVTDQIEIIHPDQIGIATVMMDEWIIDDYKEDIQNDIDNGMDKKSNDIQLRIKNLNIIENNIGKTVGILKAEPVRGDQTFYTAILPNGQTFTAYANNDGEPPYMGLMDIQLNTPLTESILLETTEDDIIIKNISNAIKNKLCGKMMFRIKGNIGTIEELSNLESDNPLYKKILKIPIAFYSENDNRGGYWSGKEIFINLWYLNSKDKVKNKKDCLSAFSHELRHALDDFLSNGKYLPTDHFNRPYRTLNAEINAFYTQSIMDVIDQITPETSKQEMINLIHSSFEHHRITKDNPRYRRLFNRAYLFIKQYLENNQSDLIRIKELSGLT